MSLLKTAFNSLSATVSDGILSGSNSDRVDNGIVLVSKASTVTPSMVFVHDVTGAVGASQDKTTEASSTTGSTFELFNSDGDSVRIVTDVNSVKGLDVSIGTGGAFTGTPVITASYRNNSGEVISLPVTVTGDLSQNQICNFSHDEILLSGIMELPVSAEPNAVFGRFIDYKITGVITTAPIAEWCRLHLGDTSEHLYVNYTSALQVNGNFAQETIDTVIAPVVDDMTLFGFDEIPAKLYSDIYRGTVSASATTERVYSDGTTFKTLAAENLIQSESSTVLFNDQGLTSYTAGVSEEKVDIINPPTDWNKNTIIVGGVELTKYWLGFNYLTSATTAWPITLFNVKSQPIHGDNVIGLPQLVEASELSKISVSADNGGIAKVLISNTRTGESTTIDIDGTTAVKDISFTGQLPDDMYFFQVLKDDGLNSPSLVTIQLS